MHFEVLVEDQSGKIALETIMCNILGQNHTKHSWNIFAFKGIGHIPKNLYSVPDPKKQTILDKLPAILRAYGKGLPYDLASVVVIVDLDDRDCVDFKQELVAVLHACNPAPRTLFRIAIEEGEAWLLGDRPAVKLAYPSAKNSVLDDYSQDSICGTWETLADAVYSGGSISLKKHGYPDIGRVKCEWASTISAHVDVDSNQSPSFQVFRDGVRNLAAMGTV